MLIPANSSINMRNIYDELGHWDLGDEGNKFDRYRKNLREIRKQSIWAIKKNSPFLRFKAVVNKARLKEKSGLYKGWGL